MRRVWLNALWKMVCTVTAGQWSAMPSCPVNLQGKSSLFQIQSIKPSWNHTVPVSKLKLKSILLRGHKFQLPHPSTHLMQTPEAPNCVVSNVPLPRCADQPKVMNDRVKGSPLDNGWRQVMQKRNSEQKSRWLRNDRCKATNLAHTRSGDSALVTQICK